MKATEAKPMLVLPVCAKPAEVPSKPAKQTSIAPVENIQSGRRPTRSTRAAPPPAMRRLNTCKPRLRPVWRTGWVIPARRRTGSEVVRDDGDAVALRAGGAGEENQETVTVACYVQTWSFIQKQLRRRSGSAPLVRRNELKPCLLMRSRARADSISSSSKRTRGSSSLSFEWWWERTRIAFSRWPRASKYPDAEEMPQFSHPSKTSSTEDPKTHEEIRERTGSKE
jgi:hypothetical protein